MRSVSGVGETCPRSDMSSRNPPTITPVACVIATESQVDNTICQTSQDEEFRLLLGDRKTNKHKRSLDSIQQHTQSLISSPALTLDTMSISSYESQEQSSFHPSAPINTNFSGVSNRNSTIHSAPSSRHSVGGSSLNIQGGHDTASQTALSHDANAVDFWSTGTTAPQLVMPSLSVLSRRPFTATGKSLGRLKIVIAGQPGSGKTSLLHASAKSCDHIVHLDSSGVVHEEGWTEVFASSRPRMWWRSSTESSSSSPAWRRRSSTEDILDRNICFVEVNPSTADEQISIESTARYVKSQLYPLLYKPLEDDDLRTVIGEGGANVVDVVLYLLRPGRLPQHDIKCMKELAQYTNVIPLLGRTDELSLGEVAEHKRQIRDKLKENNVDIFHFSENADVSGYTGVYAISTSTYDDPLNMEASDLMSSEYSPPLIPTELSELLERIFSVDGSSWLRHSVATKVSRCRRRFLGSSQLALTTRRAVVQHSLPPTITANLFGPRRYQDQIEVSNWAKGLRQSLVAHRASAAFLSDSERNSLTRLNQELQSRCGAKTKPKRTDPLPQQDPLGLLGLLRQLQSGSRMTLEVVSSAGFIGYLGVLGLKSNLALHDDLAWLVPGCRMIN